MRLTPFMILGLFPHVFRNEFNSRKILHSFIDERWGSEVMLHYVTSPQAHFDFTCYGNRGKDIYNNKCKEFKELKRTMVLTEDINGEIQLFQFWIDQYGNTGQSEIFNFTKLPENFAESCNVLKRYFV